MDRATKPALAASAGTTAPVGETETSLEMEVTADDVASEDIAHRCG
ncbi:MAG: hypothetical protein OXI96_07845 [Acidimicrobiaceae bacterium]|nr:hypothetical protein [Acidimicrobiaceae bacterium]